MIEDNPMWKGTKGQYFELYETASNYLKEKFSYIKIGGYASCGFYALYQDKVVKEANVSARKEYFIEFFYDFLQYISSEEHKSSLDFFSWHSYDVYAKNCNLALYVRENLGKYGFTETESILNEWKPGPRCRGTEADACYISEIMCALHRTPVDMLMYYDGQVNGAYQGLFNPLTNDIFLAYYAIHSFNEIYALEDEVYSVTDNDLPMLAACNGEIGKILIPNTADESIEIELELSNEWRVTDYRVLDGINGLISTAIEKLCIPSNKLVIGM